MRKRFSVVFTVVIAMMLMGPAVMAASSNIIYDSIPSPLPGNLPSVGYEATSTAELGDHIRFDGDLRVLNAVTVTMSSWATHSTYPTMESEGFMHPITLSLYEVEDSVSGPIAGTQIGTWTQEFMIPWRPEADPECGSRWSQGGVCYNGFAFTIDFDVTGIPVPEEVIYGVAFNTQSYGAPPLNMSGPYNSLNVALVDVGPSVGTDVDAGSTMFRDTIPAFFGDGTFSRNTYDSGYTPSVRFLALNGPPAGKDDCKNGGWEEFTNPSFTNQGQCIKFVNTGK